MILETFPSNEEFYSDYWGKKPFIVRGYVAPEIINSLIDGDTLAGLSLENEIRSRIITNNDAGTKWTSEHGPFDEDRFDNIGDKNWSLLVQNVEQYHHETAQLFKDFHFSPRWLIDDIMVSFSAPGGSVGPHTDSYHTFLVQGIGKRNWKISDHKITDDEYVADLEMKVLQNGFDGQSYEVTAGDVIYMPPFFGHEGKTIEAAMTFSVGFLGPKLSDILGDYAQYLEANEEMNDRFLGESLGAQSASFTVGAKTQNAICQNVITSIQSDNFQAWMAGYFSTPGHEEVENIIEQNDMTPEAFLLALENGQALQRQEHVKIAITSGHKGNYQLGIYGEVIELDPSYKPLIEILNNANKITIDCINALNHKDNALLILSTLYAQNVLVFCDK